MKPELILESQQKIMDDKLRTSIDALLGVHAAILVLPRLSECPRCHHQAHITRKVKSQLAGVPDMPACTQCSVEAERLGLTVEEII